MVFLEDQARFWLVVHLVLAAALVGAATHQVLWLRGYLSGRYGRHRAARRFAWIVLALYAATFVVGNVIYPAYKVRVRVGYFDAPPAPLDAATSPTAETPPSPTPAELASIARWFDIKEHWIGLGFVLAGAGAALMQTWDPRKHGDAARPLAFAIAVAIALVTWAGSLIGAVTVSYRSVG